jgi:hypothetical protein
MRQLLPLGAGWALALGIFLFLVKESAQWMASWPGLERWFDPSRPGLRAAYLHLLFLGVLTPFLLIFFYAQSWLKATLVTRWGWRVYWVGFGFTTWYLLADGWQLPHWLRPAPAVMLFAGALLLFLGLAVQLLGWRLGSRKAAAAQSELDLSDV